MKLWMVMLLAVVFTAGCSGVQCWWGQCKSVDSESAVIAGMASVGATDAELVEALTEVADYYADLYAQRKPFGGLVLDAAYTEKLMKQTGAAAVVAEKAQAGEMTTEEMRSALNKFALLLAKLENAKYGRK